ncbi:unnamed protein product, partial [Owenia fusiformis]
LFDAGIGADTSANDGVYSAYFTQFTKDGRYSLSILVTDPLGTAAIKTAGSSGSGAYNLRQDIIIETVEEPIPHLQRQSSAGAVGVDDLPSAGTEDLDLFPPNKVTDLKVTDFSELDETVTLEWTAPGDDYDSGTVARFEVYMHDDLELLLDDPSKAFIVNEFYLVEGDLVPQPANSRHKLVIKLPRSGKDIVFAFVMRSWDDAGKASPYSNVVTALMEDVPEEINVETTPTTTTEAIEMVTMTPKDDFTLIIAIIGGVLGFLMLVCIGVAMCVYNRRAKARKQKDKVLETAPTVNVANPSQVHPLDYSEYSQPAFVYPGANFRRNPAYENAVAHSYQYDNNV